MTAAMTAATTGIDWSVREAAAELRLGGVVPTARLRRLVAGDASRPCLSDPEAWFPVHETPQRAEALCGGCRVRELCLELALRRREFGVWGGTTTQDRDRELRCRRSVPAAPAAQAVAAASDGTAA